MIKSPCRNCDYTGYDKNRDPCLNCEKRWKAVNLVGKTTNFRSTKHDYLKCQWPHGCTEWVKSKNQEVIYCAYHWRHYRAREHYYKIRRGLPEAAYIEKLTMPIRSKIGKPKRMEKK